MMQHTMKILLISMSIKLLLLQLSLMLNYHKSVQNILFIFYLAHIAVYSYSTECIKFTRNTNNTDLLYSQCILSVGCQCLMLHHICNECKYKIPTLNTSKVFIFCRIPKYTIWYSPNYHYPNKSLITFFHIYCC